MASLFFEKARQPFCDFFSKDLYYRGLFMDKLASQGDREHEKYEQDTPYAIVSLKKLV